MTRFFLSVALLVSVLLHAQQPATLTLALRQKMASLPAQASLGLLVQGNPAEIARAAAVCGGAFRYNNGNVCSVVLPVSEIERFSKFPGVRRIDSGPQRLQVLNDTMKVLNRIDLVRAGQAPLPQAYDGTGVIVGIIDSGVDFLHPDLQDSAGETRILKLWDQNATGNAPAPYGYGYEWTKGAIDSGLCTHTDLAYYGHGTGVCGIAAGDGSSVSQRDYSGVAPKSDLIVVALDFVGANSPVAVADAADYIFTQAQLLGRPCVINASVGDYLGSHDGTDLQAQMIDNLLLAQSGRVLVGAVGNAGNLAIHVSYPISADTTFTWFAPAAPQFLVQVWADTNNFNAAQFAVGVTQNTPAFSDRGRTGFTNVAQNLSGISNDTIYNAANQRLGVVMRTASVQGATYLMEFLITADSVTNYYWALNFTGSGNFHCWSFDLANPVPPSSAAYPRVVDYRAPDFTHNVVSSFQCSNHVITVGNYVNRDRWIDYNNATSLDNTVIPGEIMWNSSVGPTRDGRIKPDIAATGANILTCGVLSMLPGLISGAPQIVGQGGFHVVSGGSSASSPVVAGAAALYLQRYPTATHLDVKNALIYCARTDTFTGTNLPDATWGFGKLDAFSTMTNCMLAADDVPSDFSSSLSAFPNPTDDQVVIAMHQPVTSQANFQLTNIVGEVVVEQTILAGENGVTLSLATLPPGVYFGIVRVSGEALQTVRIVVE
jgi:subtilisin family serine protease